MNGSGASRRRFFLVLAPLLLGSIALPAGRSEAADSKPTAAQVADGLKSLQMHVDEAAEAAAKDKAAAQKHWDEAHKTWEGIETAIRDTHQDSYTAYENALRDLEAAVKEGDAEEAADEAAAMANTTKNYLGVFAAQGAAKPEVAPAPAPAAGERTAAAAESAPAGTLARTGSGASALTALAGAAFGLGGLSVIGGSRRRRR